MACIDFISDGLSAGAIWALTMGLLLVGWLIDLFLIPAMVEDASERYPAKTTDYNLAWVLLVLLGIFGAHRFYQGKILSGFLYLFTLGVFGLGIIYDLFTLNEQIAEANTRPSGRDHAPEDKLAQTCLLTLGS